MASDDQNIYEIFADTDSENEEQFEGFSDESDNDENNTDLNDRNDLFDADNWTNGRRPALHETPQFSQNPGRRPHIPDNATPLQYFNLFVNDNDFDEMATETNRYASQYLNANQNLKQHSRFRKWVDTTAAELKRYLALIFAMGLISQSDINEYWSTDPVTSTPFFPATMSRDRFLLITSFFHLADNDLYIPRAQQGHNPLFKLGSLYANVNNRLYSTYTPNKCISLDEGMIPWRGNLSFKVYSPDKPVKYGIKVYMLSDSTNGYVSKFKLYTGKSQVGPSVYGATYDLVMDLLRGLFLKGYSLYCDNYYSSPQLFWDLYELGTTATGTVRVNRRGIPQGLKDKKLNNRGDNAVMNNGPLECLKFQDGKPVYMLSTIHGSDLSASRRRDVVTDANIMKPDMVLKYNKYMGGVDRSDQMIAYTNNIVKSFKWWKKVIFHVLAVAVLDSYILFKSDNPNSNVTHRSFRKKLVNELIENNPVDNVVRVGRPIKTPQQLERLTGRHFATKIHGSGKKSNIARLCKVCNEAERSSADLSANKRKRPGHETRFECKDCNVSLCLEPCFKFFHTCQEYCLAYKRWKTTKQPEEEE